MKDEEPAKPPPQPEQTDPPLLEIPLEGRWRWAGLVVYLLAFASVGAVLVYLLVRLGSSLPIAIGAVAVMIVGMLIMARWAGRNVS
jgi:hypothetical protein